MNPEISIIIPVCNEEASIKELGKEILFVMRALRRPFEIIFVNDASVDQTAGKITELKFNNPEIQVVHLEKNMGQSWAIKNGIDAAGGGLIVNMDGDLQNDPKDIPKLLAELENADMVTGIRAKRQDNFIKKASAKIAFLVRNAVLRDGILDIGCGIKAYKKQCLEGLEWFNGIHRFLPALVEFKGLKVAQVKVNHLPRKAGKSKYSTIKRALKGLKDLIFVATLKAKLQKERAK